jgi:hypothetical protein
VTRDVGGRHLRALEKTHSPTTLGSAKAASLVRQCSVTCFREASTLQDTTSTVLPFILTRINLEPIVPGPGTVCPSSFSTSPRGSLPLVPTATTGQGSRGRTDQNPKKILEHEKTEPPARSAGLEQGSRLRISN